MLDETVVGSIFRALKPTEIRIEENQCSMKIFGINTFIPIKEIEEYLKIDKSIIKINETSINTIGYLEQVVEVQGRGPTTWRLMRDADTITIKHPSSQFELELGQVSYFFILALADSDNVHKDLRRMILMRNHLFRGQENTELRELFKRILSIKIKCVSTHPFASNSRQLQSIAEAGIYHISFGNGVGITPVTSWERSSYLLRTRRPESVQFPLRTYISEIVAYYQLALGAESLILSYLALYNILEYFYTSASEHLLHGKIKEQLVAPDFSHTKTGKLRELAKTIRKFDQRMDEKKMLVTLLDQYFDRTIVRQWIENHDSSNGNYYTSERDIFNESLKLDLSEDQLFPTIAARIYHIRNALVHNKEGETSRFIPFSGQEKILVNESPLLHYLAEELILKTGKDIQF